MCKHIASVEMEYSWTDLFSTIKDYHDYNGSDPEFDYETLRYIIREARYCSDKPRVSARGHVTLDELEEYSVYIDEYKWVSLREALSDLYYNSAEEDTVKPHTSRTRTIQFSWSFNLHTALGVVIAILCAREWTRPKCVCKV